MTRPAASFILFAYNQERYIREAVEGALAQSYEPLEIIFSDDCSTDRTYEILREMAGTYRGPHRVRAVRTERNLGVTRHVLMRCREAAGEIIVVAAGDDISKPHRTERLVEAFGGDPSVMAVTSGYDLIDADGRSISSGVLAPVRSVAVQRATYLRGLEHGYEVIQGSTASYRKQLFEFPAPPGEATYSEDNLLNFLIYANGGRVKTIGEFLVLYRQHAAAIGNRGDERLSLVEYERRARFDAQRRADKMEAFLWIGGRCARPEFVDTALLHRDLESARIIADWPDAGPARRVAMLVQGLLGGRPALPKWQAARLFGRFPDYLPLRWIKPRRAG